MNGIIKGKWLLAAALAATLLCLVPHAVPARAWSGNFGSLQVDAAAPARGLCDGSASIAGTVYDHDGSPVAGADVQVAVEMTAYTARTGDDGTYLVEGLCAGDYFAFAVLGVDNKLYKGTYDPDGDGVPDAVTIQSDDAAVAGIDIRLLEVDWLPGPWPPCQDGTGTISGTVRGPDGQPFEGADVELVTDSPYASATTDQSGGYQFDNLCAGEYYLFAAAWDTPLAGYYDADGDGQPDQVSLASSDATLNGIDIDLTAVDEWSPGPFCDDPEGSISGTVTDQGGDAVAGAEVQVVSMEPYAEGLTADDGTYQVGGLCEGEYYVFASAADTSLVGYYDADGDGQPDPVKLEASDTAVTGIDIRMGAVPEWSPGPFCDDPIASIAGTVTNEGGDPVAGVQVQVVSMEPYAEGLTADDGTYQVGGLCEGEYYVFASDWDSDLPSMGFYDADGDGQPDPVELGAGQTATGIDIVLVTFEAQPGPLPGKPGADQPVPVPGVPSLPSYVMSW